MDDQKQVLSELKEMLEMRPCLEETVREVDVVGAVRERIETLTAQARLAELGEELKLEFKEVFEPIPHIDALPNDVYCRILLKDASKTIHTHSYGTPRKYRCSTCTTPMERK
jgi:hypothetical protein